MNLNKWLCKNYDNGKGYVQIKDIYAGLIGVVLIAMFVTVVLEIVGLSVFILADEFGWYHISAEPSNIELYIYYPITGFVVTAICTLIIYVLHRASTYFGNMKIATCHKK